MAEVFTQNGIGLVKASNARVQGWLIVKEFLKMRSDGKPGLLITEDCQRLIKDLPALQHDEKNPSDVAKEPHDITHVNDAMRYGLIFRTLSAEVEVLREEEEEGLTDYEEAMTGGEASASYITF
jgi:phage terminase large subunit